MKVGTSFAPVGPLPLLEQLDETGDLGQYHLLIAPIVLKQPDEYQAFFAARRLLAVSAFRTPDFILMDNGVIESGVAMNMRSLAIAADLVGASVVVMPDTIDDARMTVKQVRNAMTYWQANPGLTGQFKTLGVVQGRNFEECLSCANDLAELGVDWFGVPRGLTPNLGSRVRLVKTLGQTFGKPMHVLGFSENLADDVMAALAHPLVQGMDAATPLWLSFPTKEHPRGRFMPWAATERADFGRRPSDYWNTGRLSYDTLAPMEVPLHEPLPFPASWPSLSFNVRRVRAWLGSHDVTDALTEEEHAPQTDPPPHR